jgi:hypothetical protein
MSELKTQVNDASVDDFINSAATQQKRTDGFKLLEMFTRLTGEQPKMWGSSIIGYGQYHYKSDRSSQEGDWPLVGFSPRKQNLSLYVLNYDGETNPLLQKLGKHKAGKGCLYINKLADVDETILEELIQNSYHEMKVKHSK